MKILLLIDVQYGFSASEDILPYIEEIDFEQYDKIIATQFINNQDTLFYKNGYQDMIEEKDIELYPIIEEKADHIIEKDTYALPIHKLYDIVPKEEIEHIDIIGVETDACILATMFALWDEKISFTLLKARTSGIYGIHDAAKLIMRRNLFMEDDYDDRIFTRIKDIFK